MFRVSLAAFFLEKEFKKRGNLMGPIPIGRHLELNGENEGGLCAGSDEAGDWVIHHRWGRWGLPLPEDICIQSISTICITYNCYMHTLQ